MSEAQDPTIDEVVEIDPAVVSGPDPQFGSPVADKVYDLLSSPISTVGVELLDVEWTGATLRLVIDAEGGVTTGRLAEVNRLVSPLLDQHDPVPGRYMLEVSSPGIERPLRRIDHFRRAVGEQVIVKLETWADIRRVRGELLSVDDDAVTVAVVETDGVISGETESMSIAHEDIAKARTHFEWGPTPKKGGGNTPSGSGKNKNKKKSNKKKR